MMKNEIEELCKKLKPLIGRKADALWITYVTEDNAQSKMQVEAIINTLAIKHLSRRVDNKTIMLPPPSKEKTAGDFLLGSVQYGKKAKYPLYLTQENFIKQIGIYSVTGGGKTNLTQLLLLGLLRKNVPFLVVDWKRSYRDILSLPGTSRIQVFTVGRKTSSPLNWNPLRPPPGVHPQTWISVVAEALEKSHISGQGVADVFIDLLDVQFEKCGFYDGSVEKFPNFHDAREELMKKQFKGRRLLWQDSCSRILRTFCFGPASGAFNARHPVKLEELLEHPLIIELDQELPKPLRVFFSDIILRWIHLYRLSQGETDKLRHVLVLEEVHNLFPKSNIEMSATNSLENLFREIRGFGEGLISITQHPSLLPIYILGNCNVQVYLPLQHADDIQTARKALFIGYDDETYLDRLNVGEAIVKIKGRIDPCFVKVPLVPIRKGVIKDDMLGGEPVGKENVD